MLSKQTLGIYEKRSPAGVLVGSPAAGEANWASISLKCLSMKPMPAGADWNREQRLALVKPRYRGDRRAGANPCA